MRLEGVEKSSCETKVTLHKLLWILWTVHTCKIEYEITILTPSIKLLWSRVKVIFIYTLNDKVTITADLTILYIF